MLSSFGLCILYLFQFDDQEAQACAGGWEASAKVFQNFRQKVISLQNPYLVVMDADVPIVKKHADAISTYAISGGTVQWFEDPRPRAENTVAWTNEGPEHFLQPTAQELPSLVTSSIELTCTNKTAVDAQTILFYAWNESSENGATLIPSLGNDTYYIRALAEILPMTC